MTSSTHPGHLRLEQAQILRLREALEPFTVSQAYDLLGAQAHHALMRNETTPAERLTRGSDRLSTLLRLFSLQLPVPQQAARRALPELIEPLATAGIVHVDGGDVRAAVDIRPYGDEHHDWWVVCDLTPNLDSAPAAEMAADHVLGISQASSSLASMTLRSPVESALDLGTGCGVQALHLAQHARTVVATDVNDRALRMARLTAAVNGIDVDVRSGSLYEPAAGDAFDLIVTNPPFVISPPGSRRLVYRDSGMPGDEVVRRIVQEAPRHLNPGGWCQILANWAHPADASWQDRLHEWLEPAGMDAWIVQRERTDPAAYVELWLADAGLTGTAEYTRRYDEWLTWFEQEGIDAIGFGWLNLHNSQRDSPIITMEDWQGPIRGPIGPDVARWAAGVQNLAHFDVAGADVLDAFWRVAADVVEETIGTPGADDPQAITARRTEGLCRTRQLTSLEAGLLAACDGELTAGQISQALAELTGADSLDVDQQIRHAVRELSTGGYLELCRWRGHLRGTCTMR